MAKKKTAKTAKKVATKRPARKKASSAAAGRPRAQAGSCTEQELQTAAVVTTGGELMAGLATGLLRELEARGIDVAELLRTVVANPQSSQPSESVSGEENSQKAWEYARRQLERRDFADMPHLRVIGRVLDVLLNHRRFQTCTTGDVFLVFLREIPRHLEANHRQNPEVDGSFDVTMQPGRRTFNNRMARLRNDELVRPTVIQESGREEGYVLTEDGRNVFDGWPALSEIPGLELDGPVTPASLFRRQPRRRS